MPEHVAAPAGSEKDLLARVEQLNTVGIALSAERDTNRLLEIILQGAKNITNADGGTIYLLTSEQRLKFEYMHTTSLGLSAGGTTAQPIPYAPIPLFTDSGAPNMRTVAAYAVHTAETVNIPDVYHADGFDFSGTMEFDRRSSYRSHSFLTVPMRNHEAEIIGVLQLINAIDRDTGQLTVFSTADQRLAESLASQAAVALTNHQLINELRTLLEKFIEAIALAIDEKSPYTGGHCRRVPELALLLAQAVNETDSGEYEAQQFSAEDLYELRMAALLHDCGKITTPVHVVDKATKLETIFDRIDLLDTRFEILARDAEIDLLKAKIAALERGERDGGKDCETVYAAQIRKLLDDRNFLHRCNIGSEYMAPADKEHVAEIAAYRWRSLDGEIRPFLSGDEAANLNITKGTLTPTEREVVNRHIVSTINMLEALKFPKYLQNVPEIAGGHHERMDGKGYPKGLTRGQMSLQARILGIADIFEALTAADRPYKEGMKLSQALKILAQMVHTGHIDPELFRIFVEQQVYLRYAMHHLRPEQIDKFELREIRGPAAPG